MALQQRCHQPNGFSALGGATTLNGIHPGVRQRMKGRENHAIDAVETQRKAEKGRRKAEKGRRKAEKGRRKAEKGRRKAENTAVETQLQAAGKRGERQRKGQLLQAHYGRDDVHRQLLDHLPNGAVFSAVKGLDRRGVLHARSMMERRGGAAAPQGKARTHRAWSERRCLSPVECQGKAAQRAMESQDNGRERSECKGERQRNSRKVAKAHRKGPMGRQHRPSRSRREVANHVEHHLAVGGTVILLHPPVL